MTDAQLLALSDQAINDILTSGALVSWTVAGRSYNRHNITELWKLKREVEARISAADRGGIRMTLGRPV